MDLNRDVQSTIYTFLTYDDARSVECVSRATGAPASERRHQAALKVTRFMRLISSHVRMVLVFMRRCISDEAWRSHYIFVHHVPRPHACFRVWPVWLHRSPLRQHLVEIALAHADIEIGMHRWAMDHNAEVLSYQDLSH